MTITRAVRLLGALWIAAALSGCVTIGRHDTLDMPTGTAAEDPGSLIILAIDNGDPAIPPRPASTRPGYIGAPYVAGDLARTRLHAVASDYGLTEITAWPIAVLGMHCAVLRIPPGSSREQLLQRLTQDARVRIAQPMNDFASRSEPYNDPYLGLQRGFRRIDAADAQQWSRGRKVRVAVIDTGMDAAHPDFGGRVVAQRNFVDRDTQRFGRDRHGTAVAGVISASANNGLGIVGVAPEVQIIALKACWEIGTRDDSARCNSLTLAQALAAAIEERARIVNLSLTGPNDPLLSALVAAGVARGILYVGAAPSGDPVGDFPGSAPGVIPVDMTEAMGVHKGVLRAPGRDVVTLVPGGSYDFVSGPSLATAHVSGAIALLLARDATLDRDAVYGLLVRSEAPANDTADGSGINACAALADLLGHRTATPSQSSRCSR